VVRVASAYTFGALPIANPSTRLPKLEWGEDSIGLTTLSNSTSQPVGLFSLDLLLCLGGAVAMIWIFVKYVPGKGLGNASPKRASVYLYYLFAFAFLSSANILIGFSVKYQGWAWRWTETYLTSQLALYGWVLLLVPPIVWISRRGIWRGIPLGLVLSVLVLSAVGLPTQVNNHETGVRQRATLARWEALDLAIRSELIEDGQSVIAPQFYYFTYTYRPHLSGYWDRYTRRRYGLELAFAATAEPDSSAGERLLLSYDLHESGRLKSLTIQTPRATYLLAKERHIPYAMISRTHAKAIPLKRERFLPLEHSPFRVCELAGAAFSEFTGIDNQLEPLWPTSLPPIQYKGGGKR